ncbi:MAG: hypothetical protein SV765_13710 [Pseudomonadota bacterium]|nr:hypothetical protein [Pseudomonadales bacterium]MDY6921255.1 hypothetical protein [Pseudomonadota bacterium]
MNQPQVRQRRAIYTVLQDWLNEEQLVEALLVYQEHHTDKPSIALHDYLTQLRQRFGSQLDTKAIRRRLMETLLRGDAELAPDPMPLLQRAGEQGQQDVLSLQPGSAQLAVHQLISGVLRRLGPRQRQLLHEQLAPALRQRFRHRGYDLLAQYLLAANPRYLAAFGDGPLREFCTEFYVACCEVVGPVQTDQWFGATVRQIRGQDAAAGADLNRYL